MMLLLLAAASMSDTQFTAARQAAPVDVRALIERREMCEHWAGEPEWDKDADPKGLRLAEINRNIKELRCERLDRDQHALRHRYARHKGIQRLLNEAEARY